MIDYTDFNPIKKAFIFEIDNVLFPEKDYLYQVYYLFACFLEYHEQLDSKVLIKSMTQTYEEEGKEAVFNRIREKVNFNEKYRENFERLLLTAQLPLKLLLYDKMLSLMQDIVADRKKIFILTNGNPDLQLNKIRQMEWHGLDSYLICYFAAEIVPKPEREILLLLLKEHQLKREDVVIIGNSAIDEELASNCGTDYVPSSDIIGWISQN